MRGDLIERMKIYIVRHGETKWNEEGRMQGVQNSDLTEIGIDEAKKLGDRLKNTEFTKVWTSPLGRCLETTSHIVGDRDLEVEILEDLHEFNFGVFEGKPVDVLEEKYPEENYNLWNRPEKYEGNGGENFEEFFERVEKGFNRIIEEGQGGNVLVITHGIYI